MKFLAKFEPYAYAAMRIVFGFLFACHGISKVFVVLGGHHPVGLLAWSGAVIELVGGTLIFLGLFTRCAAFISSGEMAVGYFKFHQPHSLSPVSGFLSLVEHCGLSGIFLFFV